MKRHLSTEWYTAPKIHLLSTKTRDNRTELVDCHMVFFWWPLILLILNEEIFCTVSSPLVRHTYLFMLGFPVRFSFCFSSLQSLSGPTICTTSFILSVAQLNLVVLNPVVILIQSLFVFINYLVTCNLTKWV